MQSLLSSPGVRDALSVTELVRALRSIVGGHPALTDVLVRGEVGNVSRPSSGIAYFTLKDAAAQVPCVMFRAAVAALRFELRDGIEVLVRGDIDVFPAKGQAQIVARDVRPIGHGAFWLAFEQVRDRLQQEGLFAAERKRPLPGFPLRIGLVTSGAGAAMHDVLAVLEKRYPFAEVLVSPCLVQGAAAPASIVLALDRLAGRVDVAILARGGGSVEDLWAFNDEGVARAIAQFPAPIVSAVGHEVDVTIADFVADVRAPTPSAAAVTVTPDVSELRGRIDVARTVLDRRIRERIATWRERVASLGSRIDPAAAVRGVRDARQRLGDIAASLNRERGRLLGGLRD
ncbi:MAG TPA: exodeoxyribonuclease VII large subunit, partial [Thermoplasmata archaeon]|nr:exodeoxyribonuclease VII large subunit [Thermoplasmata archaeon]